MVRCATVPFLAVLVACEGPPLVGLGSVPPMAADAATADADAEADDVGSTAMDAGPDAGPLDLGGEARCGVAGLDPVRVLQAGGSNAHHVVRGSAGYLVGVVQRNDAGRFRAFLHRLRDAGEVPAPEDLTSGLGDDVGSIVLARAVRIDEGNNPPRRLVLRADGGFDVFFGHRYVPRPASMRLAVF